MKMAKHFEIVIFIAFTAGYTLTIVQELDPKKTAISYGLGRAYCMETKDGFFIKDLKIIKNRELENIIMIDNLMHSFGLQIENGIPILEWKGDKTDTELRDKQDYLIELPLCENVTVFNGERLRLLDLPKFKLEDYFIKLRLNIIGILSFPILNEIRFLSHMSSIISNIFAFFTSFFLE